MCKMLFSAFCSVLIMKVFRIGRDGRDAMGRVELRVDWTEWIVAETSLGGRYRTGAVSDTISHFIFHPSFSFSVSL